MVESHLATLAFPGVLLDFDKKSQWYSLNLGYFDLGNAGVKNKSDSLTPAQYHELVKAVSPLPHE